ncbi:Fungal specific transcription factor domain [Ceratobasidium sp. AG-Ba]|nr:Fungal specific transcription factor domain [Ceratobasidium sp. AG-Ba]
MSLVLPPTSSERIHHPPPLNALHPSLGHVLDNDDDEEDDDDDALTGPGSHTASGRGARAVRKRSSKACDNCRKAKCKCEKSSDNVACRNCVLLGQECTFLGPSRKRGPPKGYIDAIEARLHQLEALLGTVIASPDPRAQSLVADLITDPLARHIIARVDESPFGSRGRDQDGTRDPKARSHINSARSAILNGGIGFDVPPATGKTNSGLASLPLNTKMLPALLPNPPDNTLELRALHTDHPRMIPNEDDSSSGSASPNQPLHPPPLPATDSDTEPDTITDAMGQLSLNEHQQLRYHGKASGLHLLAQAPAYHTDRTRMDEAGIWRFPSSRVWPPVAEERDTDDEREDQTASSNLLELIKPVEELEEQMKAIMPSRSQQERLLKLYFVYVHPVLPVIHKEVFWRDWEASAHPDAPASSRIPTLLLLAIYAVAARYDARPARRSRAGTMWAAVIDTWKRPRCCSVSPHCNLRHGHLSNPTYRAFSRSDYRRFFQYDVTYREIGIGAMAQAWLYVGMSVRMAQDLGLHRSIDKWQAAGANTFTDAEKQTRRCIWFGCVVMDKYVSTYIGRPLAVFERDYDTRWPESGDLGVDAAGEAEPWVDVVKEERGEAKGAYEPVPGKVLECFAAASKLSAILSHIVETLYSIRPGSQHVSKAAERVELEEQLEKWMLALPPYLRYDIARGWWNVSLAPPPSIRFNKPPTAPRQPSPDGSTVSDNSISTSSARAITLCRSAANHITKIVSSYGEHFSLERGPAFLSYYVFSASIMHVTLLIMNPEDVQAQMGLKQCMDSLEAMNITWPSAGRQNELLQESKMNIQAHYLEMLRRSPSRVKRKTTEEMEEGGDDVVAARESTEGPSPVSETAGGVQLAPLRKERSISLRSASAQLAPTPPALCSLARSTTFTKSPSDTSPPPLAPANQSPSYGALPSQNPYHQQTTPVEPMFQDPAYGRWESFGQPSQPNGGAQSYMGNWDGGHVQPTQAGQGWSTSATRFSGLHGPGGRGAGTGGAGAGEYWQDYQPQPFGSDMTQSLYGIMPPGLGQTLEVRELLENWPDCGERNVSAHNMTKTVAYGMLVQNDAATSALYNV